MKKAICLGALAGVALAFTAWTMSTSLADDEQERSVRLPDVVARAVRERFPKAVVKGMGVEVERRVVYEVELLEDGKRFEVELAPDGTLVEIERSVERGSLPEAVAKAVDEAARGGEVLEIEREEIHAVLKLVKLDKPRVIYEAKLRRGGKVVEATFAADGKVLSRKGEEEGEDEDEDEEEDD